ncbi:hypothetical protein UPYG_G00231800 [Umbra pygmaea]|uniref:StAR-related lipid transfer protein 9 n=1 Tax=Umbra pygmaea TaxID=75934 RepID=A0ABD0WF83_UMBPY
MANVKVAIRVRPPNPRENVDGGKLAVQVEGKLVRIKNTKLDGRQDGPGDSREKFLEFGFDYCYWSVAPEEPNYATQDEVFQDLGGSVLAGASEGYNVCLFAYGQTGTGKTYTMMGTPDSMGLTPRICQGLFTSDDNFPEGHNSCRVEISFLEIYNERVRDLLRGREQKKKTALRVREHPDKGPYVQDLSQHVVSDYKQAVELLEEGIANRITAATYIHDASSRSHAIFTIQYTQAILENNLPSEIVSKINLVDLAGSERADPHYCRDRLTEGSNINKSLVTLGIVISALAQNSRMTSSCQSIYSVASEGDGGSTVGSHSSSLSAGGGGGGRRYCFIPYRDSVLTWLLKDSLGGNSKTIMIATVSPSSSSYNETLSTLRYAAHARNIVNKPRVNEDASVRLIRELREEIDRLKSMLLSFEMQRNPSPSLSDERDGSLSDVVLQNELKVEQLTKDWSESWRDKKELLDLYSVDINRDRAGFLIHSLVPHLITLDRDVLSTGVTFYHLREGVTRIGPQDKLVEPQIGSGHSSEVLQGGASCEIENQSGVVTLRPLPENFCMVNDREVTEPCRLAQGAVITLDGVHKFRFNHPAEAAVLRERRRASEGTVSCRFSDLTSDPRAGGEVIHGQAEDCEAEQHPIGQQHEEEQMRYLEKQRGYVEKQRGYVECLRQKIFTEQRQAERDLEREQAQLRQQHIDIQQWILQKKKHLATGTSDLRDTLEFGVQTDPIPATIVDSLLTGCSEGCEKGCGPIVVLPTKVVVDRMRLVQEEMVRHHALRRAESRVRRKRLQYQLQRIANKRHLLEAKRELQRLEKALPSGLESPESSELRMSSKSRGHQPVLRRHSFSSDLLSRLYPQPTPIFSHFLKRTRLSDWTLGSIASKQWVSEECLSRERTRSCSDGFSSESEHRSQNHWFRKRASSSADCKPPVKKAQSPCRDRPEKKPLLPKRGLELKFRNSQSASQSQNRWTETNATVNEPTATLGKSSSQTQKPQCTIVKNRPFGGSKSLENISNVFLRSVGPGIKTAVDRVFRKPPSGLSSSANLTKTTAKTPSRFHWKQKRGVVETKMSATKCTLKTTVSCEDLDRNTSAHDCRPRQRRWHSAENLNQTSPLKWVERQQILRLAGWKECDGEEEEGGGDQSSDCDSLFSVDSLSSAYIAALADQLKLEEAVRSEADSEDSEMSKDSLAMESRGSRVASRPKQRQTELVPSPCVVKDCQKPLNLKDMNMASNIKPAGNRKENVSPELNVKRESLHQKQSLTEHWCTETVSEQSQELGHIHAMRSSSPHSVTSCSARETEGLLVLSDAWSSTDAADSPRIHRDAMLKRRMVFSPGALDRSCSPSPASVDMSNSVGGFGSTHSHSFTSADSTEKELVTVEEKHILVSQETTNFLKSPDSQLIQTLAPHLMTSLNQEPMCYEDNLEKHSVRSGLLNVSLNDTGFLDNQSGLFTPDCLLISAGAPNRNYINQDISSTSVSAVFSGPQMLQLKSPEALGVGLVNLNNDTAGIYPYCSQSKASMSTYPNRNVEMANKTFNQENSPNSSGDNELCNVDQEKVGVRDEEYYKTCNTKDKSQKIKKMLNTKATEQGCVMPEPESFTFSCKNSRKRNKDHQDSFIGVRKVPKRSNEGDLLTSTLRVSSQEVVCPDDKNNSKLKDKLNSPPVNSLKLKLRNNEGNCNQDTSTGIEMSVSVYVSQENLSVCSHNTADTGGCTEALSREEEVIKRRTDVEQDEDGQMQGEMLISDRKRTDREKGRWLSEHGQRNCSPLDQRISEVVTQHMSMSDIDGDNSNSELESQSSHSMNFLPDHNPNKFCSHCSTSEMSLPCSEKVNMDSMINGAKVIHESVNGHCTSLTVMSVNQSSFISTENDRESSKTKVSAESKLSQSRQEKSVINHIDVREDSRREASGFSVITPNDQASVNSGAVILNLATNNHRRQSEDLNKPAPLQIECSPRSNSASAAAKESLINQGNIFERESSPNAQQQLLQTSPGSTSSVTTLPAQARDTGIQSKYDIHKNQCMLTSPCARKQLTMDMYCNCKNLLNNSQSANAINMVCLHNDNLLQKLEQKHIGHADVRIEIQRPSPYATDHSQEQLQSQIISEDQVNPSDDTCVLIDPDCKKDHQSVKYDKSHVEKWLKAQCSVSNFSSDNCQITINEEASMTHEQRTMSPVTCLDVPRKICSIVSSQSQKSTGSSDANMKILGEICRDIISREEHTKTANYRLPHQCTGSNVNNCKKGKYKRFRRSKAHAPPNSSSDSTIKSSSEEEENSTHREHRSRALSTRMMPDTQINLKLDERNHCNSRAICPVRKQSLQPNGNHTMEACASWNPGKYGEAGDGISLVQKHHNLIGRSEHSPAIEKKPNQEKTMSSGLKDTQLSNSTTKLEDSAMHFASSDINPFVHQWQEKELSQTLYKNQVFGSAADISCKSPLPDSSDKRITRCCSVDNGLNVKNCPFNSHLSTYANAKGLSSTLSSMEEDFKVHTSPNAHLDVSSVDDHNQPMIQTRRRRSSCNELTGDPGKNSGQLDEIMLVYSSEQEPQCNRFQRHNTRDHSTQTSITQETMTQTTINQGDLQRKKHHRRSSTQVPVSQNNNETIRATSTWVSLQNMSEHLSQLIHNTSDLLGNVQGMRSGNSLKHSPIRNSTSLCHLYSSKDWTKKDCSTQTAVDIGIQMENTSPHVQDKRSLHQTRSDQRSKAHEVNVIVKVIGSEVLSVSKSQHSLKNRPGNTIQSMPDLHLHGSVINQRSVFEPNRFSHKFPSLETVVQPHHCSKHSIHHISNKDCQLESFSASKSFAVSDICNPFSEILSPEGPNVLRSDSAIDCRKQLSFTDRACSPILTVGSKASSNLSSIKPLQILKDQHLQNINKEHFIQQKECQSTQCLSFSTNNYQKPGHNFLSQAGKPCDISTTKSRGSVSPENKSAHRNSNPKGSNECPESHMSSNDKLISNENSIAINQEERESTRLSLPSRNHTSLTFRHNAMSKREEKSICTIREQLSYRRHSADYHHKSSSEGPVECNSGPYEPFPISDDAIRFQEDDVVSLVPSECNTDILVNINPVTQTLHLQHSPLQQDQQFLPEDLPVHNKFTNWSGISQHPSERGHTSSLMKPSAHLPTGLEGQRHQQVWAEQESQESRSILSLEATFKTDRHTRPRLSLSPESSFRTDMKVREIERLRTEREQVMATVQLNTTPHPLTMELTEAKLHYGLGETDTLLKMLAHGGTNAKELSPVPTKQDLYDRHRKSIDGLRQEREARLQTCRRARSLSPSKHCSVQSPQPKSPQEAVTSSSVSALPSHRKDYLQQLRQEVVESSRIPDPPRGEGHYPSEIEQLLRDYGRAREEARTEIARARERLRERTEQEKRRLQQQALSEVVKDDLRYRTRVSNSTLCTGSSLSLSSGPTSGYHSGYTAQFMDGSGTSTTLPATGVLDDVLNGLKVKCRPPICGFQSVKTQCAWLSAQDVCLEPGASGANPPMSSSPPSPSSLRQRTASFGSASSISTAYQDIASCLLGRAMAEVHLAAAGDTDNLVSGKAAAGWRYQGMERGVRAFYKPSSSPSVHSFLGVVELERPLASLWSMVQNHSKTPLYQEAVRSVWTRPLDDCTQLVYLLTETSTCHLKQPRDFCCISTQLQENELCVLAMQSVFEETLPRPSVEAVRGEILPSAWILQPITRHGREVVRVTYLLQVDLGSPPLPQRLMGAVTRRQAAVLAELDSLFCL